MVWLFWIRYRVVNAMYNLDIPSLLFTSWQHRPLGSECWVSLSTLGVLLAGWRLQIMTEYETDQAHRQF